jgi:hypothetical protein
VGTFETNAAPPVAGHLVAFDAEGKSGVIYPTVGRDGTIVELNPPLSNIQMDFMLTQDAIPVHMGTTAFILDQVLSYLIGSLMPLLIFVEMRIGFCAI